MIRYEDDPGESVLIRQPDDPGVDPEEPRPIGQVQPYEVITGIVGLIAILAAVYGMWGWF